MYEYTYKKGLKIAFLKSHPDLTEDNELMSNKTMIMNLDG